MAQIEEAINQKITDLLGSNKHHPLKKYDAMTKLITTIKKSGDSTGFTENKPLQGSSRAVFFPSDPEQVNIDGVDTTHHVALKVAAPHPTLDAPGIRRVSKQGDLLLGHLQNKHEGDVNTHKAHSVLAPIDGKPNHFQYNPNGFIAPTFGVGEDHSFHLAGVARDIEDGDFERLTTTEHFPTGISVVKFANGVKMAKNKQVDYDDPDPTHITNHPLVKSAVKFANDTGSAIIDFRGQNLGVWKHPVSGKEHIVLRDSGYSDAASREYSLRIQESENQRSKQEKFNRNNRHLLMQDSSFYSGSY